MLSAGVVILNYNTCNNTKSLVNKIKKYQSIDKIVVIDNCSPDNSFEELIKLNNNKVYVIKSEENKGYSYGNNLGIKFLEQFNLDIIFIANPDVIFEENVVKNILYAFEDINNREFALLSAVRTDGNGEFTQRQYWRIPSYKDEIVNCFFITRKINRKKEVYKFNRDCNAVEQVEVVPGCFFAVRSTVIKKVGFLDEKVFLFFEENILAKKIKKIGYKEGIITNVQYKHAHEKSSTISLEKNSRALKITTDSALYFHEKYNDISKLKVKVLKLCKKYYLFERVVFYKLKEVLK